MAQSLHNAYQHICAKMRFLLVNDLLRRASLYKPFQHLMVSFGRIFHKSIQLSIGKSSSSPFSKLYVGIWIQHPVFPKGFHRFLADMGFLAAL